MYMCAQSCLTLCDSMDCSLPGSSVQGIFQARMLERVGISYSRESSQPRDQTYVSCVSWIGRQILHLLPLANILLWTVKIRRLSLGFLWSHGLLKIKFISPQLLKIPRLSHVRLFTLAAFALALYLPFSAHFLCFLTYHAPGSPCTFSTLSRISHFRREHSFLLVVNSTLKPRSLP